MDMITVSAKTLDEAITKALIDLQTTSDHLYYEIIDKGSSGFFGIGAKPIVIRAKVKETEDELQDLETKKNQTSLSEQKSMSNQTGTSDRISREEHPAKAETRVPGKESEHSGEEKHSVRSESRSKVMMNIDEDMIQKKAVEFLNQVFQAMSMKVEIETSFDRKEGELSIIMNGDDMGILIGKRGQTLDSLQYLVSLVVNKEAEGYLRVKLDTENYREKRKKTLETLARNIAYKVKRTKHPVSLEPMNPYERRIIHSALQNDKYVVTRSEGEDPFRHVVISLKRESFKK